MCLEEGFRARAQGVVSFGDEGKGAGAGKGGGVGWGQAKDLASPRASFDETTP